MKPLLLVVAVVGLAGCKGVQSQMSHLKSAAFGLNRTVTLYAADGRVLRTWHGNYQVEDQGGSFRFLDNDKAVTISGTVVIEESK